MFINKIKFFCIFTLFICKSALSIELNNIEPNNNAYVNPLHKPSNASESDFKKEEENSQSNSIEVNENDLLNNVGLLERALHQSVIDENIKAINILLPIYVKVENKNTILYLRALALKETFNNNINKSIELYKEILNRVPSLIIDQFRLAKNYFFNYENSEAISTLNKIKEKKTLNEQDINFINLFVIKIKERDRLTIDGSFNLIKDDNINQVTDKEKVPFHNGYLTPPKRKHATGGNFRTFLNKNMSLMNGYFLNSSFSFNGKMYWDNKEYNDIVSRFYVGGGYKNSFLTLKLNPFYEKRWFSNKPYVDKLGVNLNLNYIVTPSLQLSSYLEGANKTYVKNRSFLDGNSYSISNYATYIYNPNIYLTTGLINGLETAKDKSDQYTSAILTGGVGINWTETFSNYTGISYGIKDYKAASFFFDKREDAFIKYNLAFKYTKLSFKDFVPVLNMLYETHNSNNPLYNYNNFAVFISIDRKF